MTQVLKGDIITIHFSLQKFRFVSEVLMEKLLDNEGSGQKVWRNAAKPVFQRGRSSLLKAEAARFLSHSNANPRSIVDSNNTHHKCVLSQKLRHVTLVPAAMTGNYRWLSHFSSHRPIISAPSRERESRKLSNFY